MNLIVDEEFKNLLPALTNEQYEGLKADILKHGMLHPITVWNGVIVDGHNRYSIAQECGLTGGIRVEEISFDSKSEAIDWILSNQRNRRNMTKSQLTEAWSKYEEEVAKEAASKISPGRPKKGYEKSSSNLNEINHIRTAAIVAEKIGVSENTYRNMKLITKNGTPEQVERMDKGGKGNSVSAIAREINDTQETKVCSRCGKEYPIIDFRTEGKTNKYRRTYCKYCQDRSVHPKVKDIKGNVIECADVFRNVTDETIIDGLYNVTTEITGEDVIHECKVNFERGLNVVRQTIKINMKIVESNKQAFVAMWNEFEMMLRTAKEEL